MPQRRVSRWEGWKKILFSQVTHLPVPAVVSHAVQRNRFSEAAHRPLSGDHKNLLFPFSGHQEFSVASSQSNQLEQSLYIMDFMPQKDTNENQRNPLQHEKTRKSVIHLPCSNGIPYPQLR